MDNECESFNDTEPKALHFELECVLAHLIYIKIFFHCNILVIGGSYTQNKKQHHL